MAGNFPSFGTREVGERVLKIAGINIGLNVDEGSRRSMVGGKNGTYFDPSTMTSVRGSDGE